jgi:hypothetical protein
MFENQHYEHKALERALQQRRGAMELYVNRRVSVGSEKLGSHDNCGSALEDLLHV